MTYKKRAHMIEQNQHCNICSHYMTTNTGQAGETENATCSLAAYRTFDVITGQGPWQYKDCRHVFGGDDCSFDESSHDAPIELLGGEGENSDDENTTTDNTSSTDIDETDPPIQLLGDEGENTTSESEVSEGE